MRTGARALLVAVVAAAIAAGGGGVAAADPPACATAPAPYSGTDDAAGAVAQLNADADANCAALAARLDALATQLDGGARDAHVDAVRVLDAVTNVRDVVAGWTVDRPLSVSLPDGESGSAVEITNWPRTQDVAFDSPTSDAIDGRAQSEHGDLWVIVGAIVGTFAGGQILRKVWP